MKIKVRWSGLDWGETLIDPLGSIQYTKDLVRAVLTEVGKSEVINEKLMFLDKLVEDCGYDMELMDGIEDEIELWKRHFRFKRLQETNIEKIYSDIFDNDQKAIRLYNDKRFGFFKLANGLEECLAHLKNKKISVNVVSDLGSEAHLKFIRTFLSSRGLMSYFSDIITNQGRIRSDGSLDLTYKGLGKIDGAIYRKLKEDLLSSGIQPSQALLVGDRPVADIEIPKEYGFKAIQFIGIIKRRLSNAADCVISDLRELNNIIEP